MPWTSGHWQGGGDLEKSPDHQPLPAYLAGMETETVPEQATIVSVDMATENLLPMNGAQFAGKTVLSIDHHMSNEGYAEFTNVQPQCAACGELLLEILKLLGPGGQDHGRGAVSGDFYGYRLLPGR